MDVTPLSCVKASSIDELKKRLDNRPPPHSPINDQFTVVDIQSLPYLLSHMLTMLRLAVTPPSALKEFYTGFELDLDAVGLKLNAPKTKVLHDGYENDYEPFSFGLNDDRRM